MTTDDKARRRVVKALANVIADCGLFRFCSPADVDVTVEPGERPGDLRMRVSVPLAPVQPMTKDELRERIMSTLTEAMEDDR